MSVTIQIVNYKSLSLLKKCLQSIEKGRNGVDGVQVLVVNNEKEPIGAVISSFDFSFPVRTIDAGVNLGFGKAHNLAARDAQGEYLFFLNPDAEMPQDGLRKLMESFRKNGKIAAAGPLLLGESGRVEEEHCGFQKTPFSIILGKIPERKKKETSKCENIRHVDWISGGAMMIRKDLFWKAGGFDENFFMYFEDVDLCGRLKKLGYSVVVNPDAEFLHWSGKSFSSHREKKRHYYSSQDYYLRKNFGLLPALAVKILRLPIYLKNVYFE